MREVSPHAEPRDAAAGALGPKLLAWWAHMSNTDVEAMRVAAEIRGGLEAWEKNDRWAPLRHAGTRDEAERTLFDMILAGDIPSDKVYEDEVCHAPSVVVMTTTDRQRGGPTYYYNH